MTRRPSIRRYPLPITGALLEEAKATVAGLFGRRESRATFWDLVTGLLMDLPTANCWTVAEAVGHRAPYRLQHLVSRAVWDTDAVLAALARWVTGHLGGIGVCQVAGHLSPSTCRRPPRSGTP